MAEPQPVFRFDAKDYGVYEKYLTIKEKDFGYENMYFNVEAVPVPVVAPPKNLVEVGYRALKVNKDNKQTYGIVTYANKFGGDTVIKITWEDGTYDHQYLSVLQKEILVCPPNAV